MLTEPEPAVGGIAARRHTRYMATGGSSGATYFTVAR